MRDYRDDGAVDHCTDDTDHSEGVIEQATEFRFGALKIRFGPDESREDQKRRWDAAKSSVDEWFEQTGPDRSGGLDDE